jgi:hypothetical protein
VVIIVNGGTILAFSSVQKATALSTMEAELYALVLLVRKLIVQRRFAAFLIGVNLPTSRVGCDAQSVIAQLARRDLTARSRHVRVHLGFIHDAIDSNEISVYYVPTMDNVANTLTAAEERQRFERSRAILLGMA